MTTGLLKRTIEPTGKGGQFLVTDHFIFEGKPATETHIVYDSTSSNSYHDAVNKSHSPFEDMYVGPWPLEIEGNTYFIPQFQCTD